MASLQDIILNSVKSSAGGIEIPANIKNQVLGGLSESILGSLTQTAAKPGGLEGIKALLTGKSTAAAGPLAQLAGSIFTNGAASKLNLGSLLTGKITGALPGIVSKLSGVLKDQDGDGDVDLNDILIALKGGGNATGGGSLLGAATSILGGILGKK